MSAVCEVIGAAFADNPSTLANVGGDTARAEQVMRNAVRIAKFGRPWSHALVAVHAGRIVGALNKVGFTVTSRQEIVGVDTRFMWRDPRTQPATSR